MRSHAPGDAAFDQGDDADQAGGEDGGHDERSPNLHGLAVIGAGEETRAEPRLAPRSEARRRWRRGAMAKATATLRLAKRKASAEGQRSLQKIWKALALWGEVRTRSRWMGSGELSPFTMPMVTGKKQR